MIEHIKTMQPLKTVGIFLLCSRGVHHASLHSKFQTLLRDFREIDTL